MDPFFIRDAHGVKEGEEFAIPDKIALIREGVSDQTDPDTALFEFLQKSDRGIRDRVKSISQRSEPFRGDQFNFLFRIET